MLAGRIGGLRCGSPLFDWQWLRVEMPVILYHPPSHGRGMPEGQGVGRRRKRAKPTSGATRHLLPEEGGSIHASPFPWKGLPSTARRGWLPFLRRLGALVYRRLETIPLALFHTARTLSGSLRSPPSPRGEGYVSGIALSPSNLRPYGAPPSKGRREYPREPLPLEGAAEHSEAGLASFWGGG